MWDYAENETGMTLRDWFAERLEARPVFLSDFGWIDAKQAGLIAEPLPVFRFNDRGETIAGEPERLVPGWYAASVNHVQGYRHSPHEQPDRAWLSEFEPVARPGYAFWVYQLTADDIARFLQRHPSAPRPSPSATRRSPR